MTPIIPHQREAPTVKEIPLNSEITTAFNEIGKKIRPSQDEIEKNPRARSAIMRVFEKV